QPFKPLCHVRKILLPSLLLNVGSQPFPRGSYDASYQEIKRIEWNDSLIDQISQVFVLDHERICQALELMGAVHELRLCAYRKLKDSVACLDMIGANCNAEDVARTLVCTHSACPTDLHSPKDQPANDRH